MNTDEELKKKLLVAYSICFQYMQGFQESLDGIILNEDARAALEERYRNFEKTSDSILELLGTEFNLFK